MLGTTLAVPVPDSNDQAVPQTDRPQAGRRWLGWLVAACLMVLAVNAHRQLAIQQRILAHSQELERTVAASRDVSAETNQRLARVRELADATVRMDAQLAAIGSANEAIWGDLKKLEETVAAIYRSVSGLDDQAGRSRAVLLAIGRESANLHRALSESHRVGQGVSQSLLRLVMLQEAVNADLADMDSKTRFLERFPGGG